MNETGFFDRWATCWRSRSWHNNSESVATLGRVRTYLAARPVTRLPSLPFPTEFEDPAKRRYLSSSGGLLCYRTARVTRGYRNYDHCYDCYDRHFGYRYSEYVYDDLPRCRYSPTPRFPVTSDVSHNTPAHDCETGYSSTILCDRGSDSCPLHTGASDRACVLSVLAAANNTIFEAQQYLFVCEWLKNGTTGTSRIWTFLDALVGYSAVSATLKLGIYRMAWP